MVNFLVITTWHAMVQDHDASYICVKEFVRMQVGPCCIYIMTPFVSLDSKINCTFQLYLMNEEHALSLIFSVISNGR